MHEETKTINVIAGAFILGLVLGWSLRWSAHHCPSQETFEWHEVPLGNAVQIQNPGPAKMFIAVKQPMTIGGKP